MPALSDSSDESEGEREAEENRRSSGRGTPTQADPLEMRFSQKKMRHMFWNGNMLGDVAPLVQTLRCSKEEEARLGVHWKLVAPFPAIEVVRWRCKLRDERTGRPKVDQQTGAILYDSEEHLFTLDNRRLYCLQLAATRVYPELCTVEVLELPPGPPELMHEMKKFKTLDCGKSINIGSRQDKVPFVRWSWRAKLQVPEGGAAGSANARKGSAKAAAASGAKGKAGRKPAREGKGHVAEVPNAGALLLQLVKDGPKASDDTADGAAQGAFLLGLLKGPTPQPAKAVAPVTKSSPQDWSNSGGWWQGNDSWQASGGGYSSCRGRH